VIVSGSNQPLTRLSRLLVATHINECTSLWPWRTSGVVVLLLESHRTPFPVRQIFDPGHLWLAYLQCNSSWR
jgi:hypothetical protein